VLINNRLQYKTKQYKREKRNINADSVVASDLRKEEIKNLSETAKCCRSKKQNNQYAE
jgi:cytochrome c553